VQSQSKPDTLTARIYRFVEKVLDFKEALSENDLHHFAIETKATAINARPSTLRNE
jgi:hypothetical protein